MQKIISLYVLALFNVTSLLAQTNGTVKFGTVPFTKGNEGGKSSFTTIDFIYARAELGKTVKEFFNLESPGDATSPQAVNFSFKMEFTDAKDGKNYTTAFGAGNFMYIKPEDLARTYLNIDLMPDPAVATSVFCMGRSFKGGFFSSTVYNLDLNQYKNNSKLKITIRLSGFKETYPGSGYTKTDGMPQVTGEFELTVNHADVEGYKKNALAADQKIAANGLNLSGLPPIFSSPFKANDPKLSAARLMAILKRDFPHRKILKMALDSDGGQLWLVSKNEFGIPRYRYFNGILHVAYMEDGVCKVGKVELIENYLGAGKYAALSADYWSQYDRQIDCELVK